MERGKGDMNAFLFSSAQISIIKPFSSGMRNKLLETCHRLDLGEQMSTWKLLVLPNLSVIKPSLL